MIYDRKDRKNLIKIRLRREGVKMRKIPKNLVFISRKARNLYFIERFLNYKRSNLEQDLKLKATPECLDEEYLYQLMSKDSGIGDEEYKKANQHLCECDLCLARLVKLL